MDDKFVKKGQAGVGNIHWWHRINLPETGYTDGQCFHGPDGGDWPTTRFGLPLDCTGLEVIDCGSWDGFFSFEAEKRGAALVFATDAPYEAGGTWAGTDGFKYAHKALNSNVLHSVMDIQNPPKLMFDVPYDLVLCYGVLYHLKSPLLAVENLMKLCRKGGTVLVETAISNEHAISALVYKPGHEDDPTNYFYPTINWVHDAFFQNGTTKTETIYNDGIRATFRITK
jgi:tRNA (mo5U34)-methyltransferase